MSKKLKSDHNFIFWFHVFITALAWVGPFLFSWPWMIAAYTIVVLQFIVFDRCLLNAQHNLTDSEDSTFYSYLFEACGMTVNRPFIRMIVRKYLYVLLGLFTLLWQVILGFKPLLF